MVGRSGFVTTFLAFDEAVQLVNVVLKFSELVLRSVARGYDFHQRFQVVVGCCSGGQHLDDWICRLFTFACGGVCVILGCGVSRLASLYRSWWRNRILVRRLPYRRCG